MQGVVQKHGAARGRHFLGPGADSGPSLLESAYLPMEKTNPTWVCRRKTSAGNPRPWDREAGSAVAVRMTDAEKVGPTVL